MVKGAMSSTASFKKRTALELHQRAFDTLLKEGPLAYGGRSRWRIVSPYLAGVGMDVPEVGLLSTGPLSEVIANVSQWHRKRIEGEFTAWVKANGVDRAIVDLTEIAMGADDIQTRVAIVELAGSLGERSEAAVRGLIPTKAGGHADMWLVTRGIDEPNDDNMRNARLASFELLSLHCTGDPDDDVEVVKIVLPPVQSI
jgi:hypothetical protein